MTAPDAPFYPALVTLGNSLRLNPAWILLFLYEESALNPAADNGSYAGLSQLSKQQLVNRRIDPADYVTWPASRQVTEVIGPWLTTALGGRQPKSVGALYAYNLAPTNAAQATGPDSVILSGGNYTANAGLRKYRSGGPDVVMVSDLDTFLTHKSAEAPYQAALKQLGGAPKSLPWYVRYAPAAVAVGLFVAVLKAFGRK